MGEKKSNIWHLVLFEDADVTREAVEMYCKRTPEVKLCAREAQDDKMRPHYHIAHLLNEEICRSTMKAKVKKHFPTLFGKSMFNCHTNQHGETIEGLYNYLCKGAEKDALPDIVYNQFLDTKAYHSAFYDSAEKFKKDSKSLAEKRAKEATQKSNKVIAEAITYIANIKDNIRFHIVEYIVNAYQGKIDDTRLTPMVNAVEYAKDKESCTNMFYQRIERKLNPRL